MKFIFIFDKEKTVIEGSDDDYFDDLCNKFIKMINVNKKEMIFLYKGKKINQNFKINKYINEQDLKNKKINFYCIKIKHISKEKLLFNKNKLKEIICPECGELCKIKFDDYKIILYGCKNKHKLNNIEFENFIETQNIGQSKIKFNNCNKIEIITKNDEFYNCLEYNKSLILSEQTHNKENNIKKYKEKHYICNMHNKRYISYCKKCNKNLCLNCENEHKNENSLIYYKDIIPDINETYKEEIKLKIEKFNNNIKDIIEKLNKLKNKIKFYYEFFLNIINNCDLININYQMLNNINEMLNYNNKIILNDINEIIEEPDDYKKINKLIDLYNIIFNSNKNIIKYKIEKDEEKVKIFGYNFVKNNKNMCKIIYEDKEYDLTEFFYINNNNTILEIELKINDDIIDMSYMFENCTSLIYFSNNNWNTKKVNNMSYLFKDCLNLSTILGISEWKTDKLNRIEGMFYNCIKLRNLSDISKWKTNKVIFMPNLFYNCSSLSKLPDISKWDMNNVGYMNNIFYNCISLLDLPDISNWKTSNLKSIRYMFFNCVSLNNIPDISKWNIDTLEDIESLFNGCSSLKSIPNIGKWKIFEILSN